MNYWEFLRKVETELFQDDKLLVDLYSGNPDLINYLRDELGVVAYAIVVLDSIDGRLLTVESSDLQSGLDIDFPSFAYSIHQPALSFIDLLFLGKRDIQKLESTNNSKEFDIPEFFITLFDEDESNRTPESEDLSYIRRKERTLLCPHGEILLFLYVWRYIIRSIQSSQDSSTARSKIIDEYRIERSSALISWKARNSLYSKEENEFVDLINNYLEYFPDLSEQTIKNIEKGKQVLLKSEIKGLIPNYSCSLEGQFTRNDWKILGLIDEENKTTEHFHLLIEHVSRLSANDQVSINRLKKCKTGEISALDFTGIHEALLNVFMDHYGLAGKKNTEILKTIHTVSRFPIIPYYAYASLTESQNRYEHMAFPLWKSYNRNISFRIGLDNLVHYNIYSLLTVNNLSNHPSRNEQIQKLRTFLNLIAKPVIEKVYVNNIFKNFFGKTKYEYDAHEIRHLVRMIDKDTDREVLDEIKKYFGIVFSSIPTLEKDYSLPSDFGKASSFKAFFIQAITYGVRLQCLEDKKGSITSEDFKEYMNHWIPLFNLTISNELIHISPDKVFETNVRDRLLFFSALVAAIKNTIKHADDSADIDIYMNLESVRIVNVKKRSPFTGESVAIHPGNTFDSIRYNVSNYSGLDFLNDKITLDNIDDVKFETKFPVPRLILK